MKNMKWGKGKGTEISGKKIKILKIRAGKNIKLRGTLYPPALNTQHRRIKDPGDS